MIHMGDDFSRQTEEVLVRRSKKSPKPFVYEGSVDVCAHHVTYYFDCPREVGDLAKSLDEEAESRARAMIQEGYISGELNYESEEVNCRGWWQIE
jgi:hypothetical protein